jgi:hypothetical protein
MDQYVVTDAVADADTDVDTEAEAEAEAGNAPFVQTRQMRVLVQQF